MATIADIEVELLGELGPYLSVASLDATTVDGTNASLRTPIRRAITALGGTVAAPPAVTDDDVSTIEDTSFERFIQVCKLFTLEKVLGNWPHVDERAGEELQHLSQLADRIVAWIKELKDEVGLPAFEDAANYVGPARAGIIMEDFEIPRDPLRRFY